MSDVFVQ